MSQIYKTPKITYKGKKELIREIPCVGVGMWATECCEGVDPAHLKHELYAGGNLKDDRRILPVCRSHHSLQGTLGEAGFWHHKLQRAKNLADFIHIIYLELQQYEEVTEDYAIYIINKERGKFLV